MADEGIRVLLVEDSAVDRKLIELLLSEAPGAPFVLAHVDRLAAALLRLSVGGIDVVLLDLGLPDSFGFETCQIMRAQAPHVPIVVFTSLDNEEMGLHAVKYGAQDYLVKGRIDRQLLSRSLRYALERARTEQALLEAHNELERRVIERTAQLKAAYEDLHHEMLERRAAEERARRHQEELAHVARLNTLGEMASGLAHELNQPLTAIMGYTKSCLKRLRSGRWTNEQLVEEMDKAATQATRAAEIIRRLRALVTKRRAERTPTDVNETVREAAAMVELLARTNFIQVRLELGDSLPMVLADRIQIEQVLLNLMRNGLEAIATSNTNRRELVVASALDELKRVAVTVRDSGRPVQQDELDRLFEPFYTTKAEGLGLGLSISRSIIEAHEGELTATANADGGLTFRFALRAA
jgi:C4-dicarboxylate-specific signal transduction histidine kinase